VGPLLRQGFAVQALKNHKSMPKKPKAILVHGWDGSPDGGWFPWLKKELESKGFKVLAPQLPKPEEPRISNWVPKLKEVVGTPDEQTYFIGHSMGCQAIARYLAALPEGTKVGGAVFVAGFFKSLTGLEDDEIVRDVADEWLKTPIDLSAIGKRLKKSIAVFADNDPYVSADNQEDFADKLKAKIIVEHGQGHFDSQKELPIALKSILEIADK